MPAFEKMKKGLHYPTRSIIEVKGILMNKLFGGNSGNYIMDQDWDNLIILDACRFDIFKECVNIDGELKQFHSRGSHTGEFIKQNFGSETFLDTVYVSSNPNPAKEANADFASVEKVWETGWDENLHTVPPEVMRNETIKIQEEWPNKRLISHFLQPHYPWIGPQGKEFMERHGYTPQDRKDHIWMQLRDGDLKKGQVWELYKENLQITLTYINDLTEKLVGKSVITSDHGNAFGEWGVYGHPPRAYISSLVTVPWLELPYKDRKQIESSEMSEEFAEEEIPEEHLRDLGYV